VALSARALACLVDLVGRQLRLPRGDQLLALWDQIDQRGKRERAEAD